QAGVPWMLHYVSSKGAVDAMTRATAREVGDFGIRVNSSLATVSIIVSLIASPMVSSAIQQYEINQLK
ncbi:MAG: SDR family oxidoreductase, partial [Planctomycetes bacterium]|nr:SDR family oxidoreductase [Planctomycetota bacterium]